MKVHLTVKETKSLKSTKIGKLKFGTGKLKFGI